MDHGDPMGELYTAFNTDADGGVDVSHGLSSWSDGDEYDDDPFLTPAGPDAPEEPDDVWSVDEVGVGEPESFDDDGAPA